MLSLGTVVDEQNSTAASAKPRTPIKCDFCDSMKHLGRNCPDAPSGLRKTGVSNMPQDEHRRRFRRPRVCLRRRTAAAPTTAQPALPAQPAERTKTAFLERARELRDQSVREGDRLRRRGRAQRQIVGEGRAWSCATVTRPRIPSCWRCAMRHADCARATCRIATSIPPPRHARCARARCTGRACAACSPTARSTRVLHQSSDVEALARATASLVADRQASAPDPISLDHENAPFQVGPGHGFKQLIHSHSDIGIAPIAARNRIRLGSKAPVSARRRG